MSNRDRANLHPRDIADFVERVRRNRGMVTHPWFGQGEVLVIHSRCPQYRDADILVRFLDGHERWLSLFYARFCGEAVLDMAPRP